MVSKVKRYFKIDEQVDEFIVNENSNGVICVEWRDFGSRQEIERPHHEGEHPESIEQEDGGVSKEIELDAYHIVFQFDKTYENIIKYLCRCHYTPEEEFEILRFADDNLAKIEHEEFIVRVKDFALRYIETNI